MQTYVADVHQGRRGQARAILTQAEEGAVSLVRALEDEGFVVTGKVAQMYSA